LGIKTYTALFTKPDRDGTPKGIKNLEQAMVNLEGN
jgi:hypothetical protein